MTATTLRPCSSCRVLFTHPTRDRCSKCSGWACAVCGRPKSPEMECGRRSCKRRVQKTAARQKKGAGIGEAKVLPIGPRGQ